MNLRQLLFLKASGGKAMENTATGNPLTFTTNIAKPLKSLLIPWTPTQAGSGDPSPENVRSISGITGLTVSHSGADTSNPTTYPVTFPAMGKNLINDSEIVNGYVISENGTVTENASGKYVDYTPVSNEEYTISAYFTGGMQNYRIHGYDANKNWVEQIAVTLVDYGYYSYTFTPRSNIKYIRLSCNLNSSQIQLERGSSRTAYEPYTNTVYGGSLDLTTGVLTVEWAISLLSELTNWSASTLDTGVMRSTVPNIQAPSTTQIPTNAIMDRRKAKAWSPLSASDKDCFSISNAWQVVIPMGKEVESVESFLTEYGNAQLCYPLATTYEIQLAPQQITTLIGDNTIWTDTNGTNTAIYLKRG